jgi:protein-tyrosine phosphatase
MADSLAMARVAASDGIRTIVATPHGEQWGTACSQEELEARVAELQLALDSNGIPIRVLPGLENYLTPDLPAQVRSGQAPTINGTHYLMVELPFDNYPFYTEQVLFQLQTQGLTPILAHPERNSILRSDHEILGRLVARGIVVQLTAASLLGVFGSKTREAAEAFLRRNLAHILATDSHSANGGRQPTLSQALARAARVVGQERAQRLVTATPEALLAGRPLQTEPPLAARGRRWGFWR